MQSVPRFAITTESNARLKISNTLRAKLAEKGIPGKLRSCGHSNLYSNSTMLRKENINTNKKGPDQSKRPTPETRTGPRPPDKRPEKVDIPIENARRREMANLPAH